MSGGHNPTTESFLVLGMEIVLGWEGKAITATTSRSPAAPKLVRVTISRAVSNWHFVSEGGSVSSSWKWKPVIRSSAHNPLLLQLPMLLHSLALADIQGIIHSPLTKLATSTVLLVSTVLCVFRCWVVPTGMRHHGNQVCLVFDCEVDTAFSLLLPANQWYKLLFLSRLMPFKKRNNI